MVLRLSKVYSANIHVNTISFQTFVKMKVDKWWKKLKQHLSERYSQRKMMHESSSGANPSSTSYSQHPIYRNPSCSSTSPGTSSSCCFSKKRPHKPNKPSRDDSVLCCCCTCPTPTSSASVLTCLGVCIIVLVYTLLGAFAFMALEGTFATFRETETSVAASQPNPSTTDSLVGAEIRSKTVEKLWSITEDLNILYKDNWTRLAAQEVMEFQDTLVRAMRGSTGVSYRQRGTQTYLHGPQHRWSFSSSFLYSLTLITTIGESKLSLNLKNIILYWMPHQ